MTTAVHSDASTTTSSPARRGKPAARVTNLHKSYGDKEILRGIDLTIREGEIVAIIGRSGSGKSTLLRILAGLSENHTGETHVEGAPSVAFQEPRLFPWLTVAKNVALGLNREGVEDKEALERAEKLLEEVHLPDRGDSWPHTLSGGQAQRVSLARALISEPKLLLLDEPFGALDALTRISAQELLLEAVLGRNIGVLLVTHDVDEAVAIADEVVLLEDGKISQRTTIDIDKPRDRASREFSSYTAQLLKGLGVDTSGRAA
ncbi:ABC transporter ATP-binding protein [Corynebacterium otitidis]|uniref:Aliphatic sulfonates import ATP-binding protein ssuB n=1 Tax=Corynebacterium otitidis ATCC 51513 TaxID=883169 RepID=I7KIR3_9CORY|nr:ABC transporter ATP-binding protein [Corynebacterium otitidis]EJZ82907.1 hypothetical protein HMPREF9719_00151 [Corynebacterium otitidis ATCC 51513]CCI83095.1 Aliphatic sulfonates import ATP-binding protein ssuB [Corynebacterium otitidis ATCC 51513]